MTPEEAKMQIQAIPEKIWNQLSKSDSEAMEIAFEALEKQIPAYWQKEDRGGVEYTAVCPKCGYGTYWSDTDYYEFCPACGQALKVCGDEVDYE